MYYSYKYLLPILLSAALSACGGGGSSSSSPTSSASSSNTLSSSPTSSSSSISSSSSSAVISSVSSSASSAASSASRATDPSVDHLYSLAEFPVGMAVLAGTEDRSFLTLPEKQTTIAQHFSQLTPGNIMKMSYLHPSENVYAWDNADAMLTWADANGLTVHGHVLVWHADYQIPSWMSSYTGNFATMLDKHVTDIVTHYADRLPSWDVVNEAIDTSTGNCYRNSIFYQKLGADYIPRAFIAARAADPNAELYYNDYDTEGGSEAKLTCLEQLIDSLQTANVPIDGIGFQMHVQIDWPAIDAIKAAFQMVVDKGLKVKITELDVPVNNPFNYNVTFPQYTTYSSSVQTLHKARYKAIAQAYLDVVPAAQRGGFTIWGLWDGDSWLHELDSRKVGGQSVDDWPLLFSGAADGPYTTKPPFDGVVEAFMGL